MNFTDGKGESIFPSMFPDAEIPSRHQLPASYFCTIPRFFFQKILSICDYFGVGGLRQRCSACKGQATLLGIISEVSSCSMSCVLRML